ncbi:PAS domain S-box protein [Chelativorans salis]|uniref:histidine kinase n=1 Tax=Chelativorans salis TaxID=2978478 RepID=A0ABT2LHH9_9HYPH|nr:PAS domain S-box protein [Chelativorans sp. EGI FJ00035]MCT7374015.1 PAS domain S-box protein [Chelativorans sp. EGI FJ00035]
MASAYSFLDIAVLDEVRERFAAGDALAVLSVDLAEIVWANGAGAAWLGYPDIEAAIGNAPRLPAVALRQVAAAPGFPDIGRDRPLALRLAGGLKSRIVSLQATAIALPRGEKALLLALPSPVTKDAMEKEQAERIVAGFDEPGHFAALLDAEGNVAAASEGFEALGITADTLRALVEEVHGEEDRLVKKPIAGAHPFPAGIARLTDAPATHLLVVVDEGPTAVGLAVEDEDVAESTPEALQAEEPEPVAAEPEEPVAAPVAEEPRAAAEHSSTESRPESETHAARTVRFAWRTDEEGRFSAISEGFAEAMGAPAADIIGRSFREVSNAFGLDPTGSIARLLERRDTWSGRTVMWPLSGTELKVPVDLAALPVYGRGHTFEGFRGFGIARLSEAEVDPEKIGLALTSSAPEEKPEDLPPSAEHGEPRDLATEEAPAEATTDPFLGETPAISISDGPERPTTDKVIRLAEHREDTRDTRLSASERTAFREIGERLRRASEAAAARAAEVSDAEEPKAAEEAPAPEAITAARETRLAPEATADAATEEVQKQAAEPDEEQKTPPPDFIPSAFAHPAPERREKATDTGLLTHLPLPILIHSGDRLHYANREFFTFTGYEDLAALEAAGGIGALFEEPQDGAEEAPSRALRLTTAQGTDVPVEAHLQSMPWENGKALMLALRPAREGVASRAEDADEVEARLMEMRAIVDTATDGIAVIADDGTIRSINRPAEALFGFDAEHVTGKPFSSLFAIESQRTVQDYLTALADNGVASVLNDGRQVIGREAQGRFIPLFITIGRLPNQSGYCAVLRDITHWKRAEEELTQARAQAERASSQKSEFLARVSHEIRTPLNAIIGFSELMIDEKFGPIGNERYRDYLRDINRSGNHVLDLVNDLLDISKIEAGQQEMQYEAVPLNETLGEVVAMMQPQANSERVIIRSSFASRLPDVVADLRSVRQIALNILSNAVRYTPAGGQVIVSTAYDTDGSVVMRVRDTGVGMSSAEIDEALKPFKQINTLRRKRGDGTGLGLPLTRAMVEANRAQFTITSRPGEGTLVEITFPPTRVLAD